MLTTALLPPFSLFLNIARGGPRYGVYTTALRVLVPDDAALSFQLLFGYVGALALLTLLPVALILAKAAPQVFAGLTPTVLGFIVVNGLCDNVISDYLWVRGLVWMRARVQSNAKFASLPASGTTESPTAVQTPLTPNHRPAPSS